MIAFVYRCEDCQKWSCLKPTDFTVAGAKCSECNSANVVHTDTIDPAVIITRWLNGVESLATEIHEQVHNGASISDIMALLEENK